MSSLACKTPHPDHVRGGSLSRDRGVLGLHADEVYLFGSLSKKKIQTFLAA